MNIRVLFWDFDGVLLRSNHIRDRGFSEVLSEFPMEQVEELLAFHRENGGLSRYVKFRHFFENIRNEKLSDEKLGGYAARFSEIMMEALVDSTLLIESTNQFVKDNVDFYDMHIVSGSDQFELRFLCDNLNISNFFSSIHGSPTPKSELIRQLINKHRYERSQCILIGDSVNDLEAAKSNEIGFQAFGNDSLNVYSTHSVI